MAEPIATLTSITFECADAGSLATFYGTLLGLQEEYASEDRRTIAMAGAHFYLSFVARDDYEPPRWPSGSPQQQLHLDLTVQDLEAGERAAIEAGARRPEAPQPEESAWRVLLDPAGHPFCLMLPFE